jgi:DNA N-6-adenine-methyltransferase (Dam)
LSEQSSIPGLEPEPAAQDESDERYTTRETLQWCMATAGVDAFDLDVAACDEAHCAPEWYDVVTDGLKQRWHGLVFCNPPFSDCGAWVTKAWQAWYRDDVDVIALLLPANRTEQPWWQEDIESLRDGREGECSPLRTHFLPGRVRFGHPGNREGVGVGSPKFGCVLLVWRR